jgi:hypothetical protein
MTKRMPATLVLLAVAGGLAAAPASAQQLARQSVYGSWRECVYAMRATLGSSNPRQRIGVPTERAVRVGRGEPCPVTYPGEPRQRRSEAGPSTWTSEPEPGRRTRSSTWSSEPAPN